MGTFFCPYLGTDVDDSEASLEHVIPGALGGSAQLAVTVQRKANNQLGTEVDGPMTQMYGVRRAMLGLRGHSKRDLVAKIDAAVPALGGQAGTLEVSRDAASFKLKPAVQVEQLENGNQRVRISGDPAQAQQIADDYRRAREAEGKTVSPYIVTPQRIDQPEVTAEIQIDLVAQARFYAKVALGIGHWLWGETWSRGAAATALRRQLWSTTIDELNQQPAVACIDPGDLKLTISRDEHGFFVCNRAKGKIVLASFFFGNKGFVVEVGDGDFEPLLVLVDTTSKTTRKLDVKALYGEGRVLL
jgi:hypothetical protein